MATTLSNEGKERSPSIEVLMVFCFLCNLGAATMDKVCRFLIERKFSTENSINILFFYISIVKIR